jgi:hypothetical protein
VRIFGTADILFASSNSIPPFLRTTESTTSRLAQSQSTSCGMHRKKLLLDLRAFGGCQGPHSGPPMAGRPVVSPSQRGQREQRHPGAPSAAFTGHPPYSVRKVRDLGMKTREIPTNPYSAGVLGTADQGKAVGATSWRGRLPAMHLVSTPDPNPGRAPRRHLLCAHQLLSAWHERWGFSPPWRRVAC